MLGSGALAMSSCFARQTEVNGQVIELALGFIGRALAAYAAETVVKNTVPKIAGYLGFGNKGEETLKQRGYDNARTEIAGQYTGHQDKFAGVLEQRGAESQRELDRFVKPGYAIQGGISSDPALRTPLGLRNGPDLGWAVIPNQYQDIPQLGPAEIVALRQLANFIRSVIPTITFHELTIIVLPVATLMPPDQDGAYNSRQPTAYRSAFGDIIMRAQYVGSDRASVATTIVPFGSRTAFYEEAIPLFGPFRFPFFREQ